MSAPSDRDQPSAPSTTRAAAGKLFTRSAFWLWAALSVVLTTTLMVAHTYALPRPSTDDAHLQRAVAATRAPGDRRWVALHVLYSGCRCSERLLARLFERRALSEVSERIVLVGAHTEYEQAALASGFALEVIEPEQLLARYGLSAAPLFVVADEEDQVRYVGGYTERKQGLESRDLEILQELRRGDAAAELPLFGCAVSQSLRTLLDPFGLKSSQGKN